MRTDTSATSYRTQLAFCHYWRTARTAATAAVVVLVVLSGPTVLAQDEKPVQPVSSQTASRDAIDARAPEDRRATAVLARTKRSIERQDWNVAVQQLQGVLEQPTDAIVRVGPGQFRSMRAEAGAMLLSLPDDWKRRYRTQFGNLATRALDEALQKSDYAAVADVATRYLLTSGGMQAAQVLAARHMDRGEFALAKHWFDRMQEFGYQPTTTLQKVQLARAKKLLGLEPGSVTGSIRVANEETDADTLLKQIRPSSGAGRSLDDWPMLMGTASRDATSADRLPILVKAWKQPLIRGSLAREAAAAIQRQLLTNESSIVPAAVPIVIGSKVACRTTEGVSVFDSQTGQLLWRTETEPKQDSLSRTSPATLRVQTRYRSGESQLTSFLFRDAVHGLIGSDGTRLFVIQDQVSVNSTRIMWSRRGGGDPAANTNVLAAYNLEDGSIAWRTGGPPSTEPFRSQLAGYYFHGVPASHLGDLFVVAEKGIQVSLVCLDASTGELKWSQSLGFSDSEIGRDATRRHWAASVTIANGLILCPTNADWLVAVDPLSRNIAWLHRYKKAGSVPPAEGTSRRRSTATPAIASQWSAAAPLVVGSTVIFTPAEAPSLIALDVATGQRLWSQPKSGRRYIAGVTGSNLVVVSNDAVECLRAADGRTQWKQPLDSRNVAGRGVVTTSHFHVPLDSGEIVSLDLKSGDVQHRTRMARGSRLVANMVMHAGGTLLQTPTDLEAFELRTLERGVARTPQQQLKAAEIMLADGDTDAALLALEAIESSQLSQQLQTRRNAAMRDCLRNRIERGTATADADVQRLRDLGMPPAALARLAILAGSLREEYEAVFRQLVILYQSPEQRPVQESGCLVQPEAWISPRLLDAYARMKPGQRDAVDDLVRSVRDDGGVDGLDRFLNTFGFHSEARAGLNERFATLLSAGRFAEAEAEIVRFRRLWPERVSDAIVELAGALANAGHVIDAATLLKSNGLAEQVAELASADAIEAGEGWRNAIWDVKQLGLPGRGTTMAERSVYHPDVQLSQDTVVTGDPSDPGRLQFLDATDGSLYWTVSLGGTIHAVIPNGRVYLVLLRDRLVAVAPQERRRLWEQSVRSSGLFRRRAFRPLVAPTGMYSNDTPRQLPVINEDYICYRDQQSIQVFDATTGAIRWSRDDVTASARIFGTTDAMIVASGDDSVRVLRSQDGKEIGPIEQQTGIVTGVGANLVCRTSTGLPLFRTLVLRSVDPITGELAWRHRFPGEPKSARINDSQVVVRHGNRKLSLVDLSTGERTDFEADTPFPKGNYSVAVTNRHVVLVSTGKDVAFARSGTQAVDTEVRVFDRETGDELWKRETQNARLSTTRFHWLPILVLMENSETTEFERIGPVDVWDTVLLDMNTGKELASQSMSTRLNRSVVSVDPARHLIEILTASRRYRFSARRPQGENKELKPAATVDESADK